ncbi:MAG: glycosyltransferase [Chloroflexota bacterium]|nr:glycosyltransferase [Chloroflexota bacterium]
MFASVATQSKTLEEYRGVAPDEQLEEIVQLSRRFQGARVLNVNATAFGGGVAELLATAVPLMRDMGIDAEWRVMEGAPEFFAVTKSFHNALQGMEVPLTEEVRAIYTKYSQRNAELFDSEYDFVIMHDPQVAGIRYWMLEEGRGKTGKWIWRCHIDLTDARENVWQFLRPWIEAHDAAVFTSPNYVKPDLHVGHIEFIAPAIDPLSPKNRAMSQDEVAGILARYAIDPDRPILAQISRYDPWKDPLGVVDVYRLVREQVPGVQLVMVATMASDDPEGMDWYHRTAEHAGEDPNAHLLTSEVDNSVEVNAFQRAADVVLQKSRREGFGLVVAEALWKGTPVVAGRVGGIPLQLRDGQDGYLIDSTEEAAEKATYLLLHPEEREEMGRSATEHIRSNFLITRTLLQYLRMFEKLSG